MRFSKSALALFVPVFVLSCQRNETAQTSRASRPPRSAQNAAVSDMGSRKVAGLIAREKLIYFDHALLGSQLDGQGHVKEEKLELKAGEPVALTMWIRSSPPGLQTSAVWSDDKQKEIAREARAMNGAMVATFQPPKLAAGKYHVTGYWGGNFACEFDFTVVGPGKRSKK